jgi:hypothetical protein
MKVKTSRLSGAALDWAVALCKGIPAEHIYIAPGYRGEVLYRRNVNALGELTGTYTTGPELLFSTKWEAGGPIIEREEIYARPTGDAAKWEAMVWRDTIGADTCGFKYDQVGSTPLIAAMRCYVASKLGEEVEIPEGLTGE